MQLLLKTLCLEHYKLFTNILNTFYRLRDISEETANQQQPRRRSNSLPIPKIEISLYQSTELKKQETNKDFIEVPEVKEQLLAGMYKHCNA